MSKSIKKLHSEAINAFISSIVNALFVWVCKWNHDAFFFFVIGDKTCTDVVWFNTENLSCEGALAISEDPYAAGAFQDIATSVDILLEDQLKKEEYQKIYDRTSPSKGDNGWVSFEDK